MDTTRIYYVRDDDGRPVITVALRKQDDKYRRALSIRSTRDKVVHKHIGRDAAIGRLDHAEDILERNDFNNELSRRLSKEICDRVNPEKCFLSDGDKFKLIELDADLSDFEKHLMKA